MAHRTKVGGTAYEISGGKTKVNGTAYGIDKGKTKINGAGYEIAFSNATMVTLEVFKTSNVTGTGTTGSLYINGEFQTITFQVDPTMVTFADLAASSQYNHFSPIEGGHSIEFFVHTNGKPGVRFISCLDGVALDIAFEEEPDASSIVVNNGNTVKLSQTPSLLNWAYGTWVFVTQ